MKRTHDGALPRDVSRSVLLDMTSEANHLCVNSKWTPYCSFEHCGTSSTRRAEFEESTMSKIIIAIFISLTISAVVDQGEGLYCYRCTSNQPGCGTPLNWLWYWGETCPEYDDKCVKIIERKGAETMITRECLSSVRSFRTDIPADKYEGCRPAAKDVRLGHYVNNSIHQLDIHRDYYDEVTWCFCYFDHRCNSTGTINVSILLLFLSIIVHQFAKRLL